MSFDELDEELESLKSLTQLLLVQFHSNNDWLEMLADQILVEAELVMVVGNKPLKMTIVDVGVPTEPIAAASIAVGDAVGVACDAVVADEVGSVDAPAVFDYCVRPVVPCFSDVEHCLDLGVLG